MNWDREVSIYFFVLQGFSSIVRIFLSPEKRRHDLCFPHQVSGEGEMRFDHETGRWTWEGPVYEMEDLRYVASPTESGNTGP